MRGLKGASLIDAKKKHHIGPLKNEQQLVKTQEKTVGEELGGKVKREASKQLKRKN